jgi:hypothetical protein
MLEEIIRSTRGNLAERFASPLMGSFSISWAFWNYKFLVILFSSTPLIETFDLIKSISFPDTSAVLLKGIVLPGLTAAIYIFVYPYPAKFVYEFTRNRQKEINDIRRRIEDETPLTLEESRRIRSELHRTEKEHREEIDSKSSEIERLKAEIASLRSSPKLPNPTNDARARAIKPDLEKSQVSMLRLIEKAGGKAFQKEIIAQSKQTKMKTEFDLGELERLGLLKKDYESLRTDYRFEFTHAGRAYLLALPKSSGGVVRRAPAV